MSLDNQLDVSVTTVKCRFKDYHSTLPLRDLRLSESHLVLLLYLTSLNKESENPTG